MDPQSDLNSNLSNTEDEHSAQAHQKTRGPNGRRVHKKTLLGMYKTKHKNLYKPNLNDRSFFTEMERAQTARVLRKPVIDRTPEDIATLVSFLAAKFPAMLSELLAEKCCIYREFKKGDIIYEEGDKATGMFMLLSGAVATRVRDVAQPNKGYWAGEMKVGSFGDSALGQSASEMKILRVDTKYAMEDTECLEINGEDFQQVIKHSQVRAPHLFLLSSSIFLNTCVNNINILLILFILGIGIQ